MSEDSFDEDQVVDLDCATVGRIIGWEVAQDLSQTSTMLASRTRALGDMLKNEHVIPDDLYDDAVELATNVSELFDTLIEAIILSGRTNCER